MDEASDDKLKGVVGDIAENHLRPIGTKTIVEVRGFEPLSSSDLLGLLRA
jgi:hypothetical protein